MTREVFIRQAMDQISDNPRDRLSPSNRILAENENIPIDNHAHLMYKECVSGWDLLLRISGRAGNPDSRIDEVMEWLYERNHDNQFDEIINILNRNSMEEVLQIYLDDYSPATSSLVSALMMDFRFGWRADPILSFSDQARQLNQLAETREVLPFLALDPRGVDDDGDFYSLFLELFGENGYFQGVKCYPALGYLPSDPRNMAIFEVCEAKRIPLTTHSGGTTISTLRHKVPLTGMAYARAWDLIPIRRPYRYWDQHIIRRRRKVKAEFLNHPSHWIPVLQAFPRLKLNLAHMGGNDHWAGFKRTGRCIRLDASHEIMECYENVFSDIAGIPLDQELLETYRFQEKYPLFTERGLYGSDFWVNLTAGNFKESIQQYKSIDPQVRKRLECDTPRKFLWGS